MNILFDSNIQYILEDINNETKEKAKREVYDALNEADKILFHVDPELDRLMESLEEDEFSEHEFDDDDEDDKNDYYQTEIIVNEKEFEVDNGTSETHELLNINIDDENGHDNLTEDLVSEHDDPTKERTNSSINMES